MQKDWVAHCEDEYVQLALAAAADMDALANLRGRLRQHMLASPLCDTLTFVRNLEDVYHWLWTERAEKRLSN
jgi:predicted O-linked N-acetylglucosamine transferase (SPINDLY family)